jgi:hypothetical protein
MSINSVYGELNKELAGVLFTDFDESECIFEDCFKDDDGNINEYTDNENKREITCFTKKFNGLIFSKEYDENEILEKEVIVYYQNVVVIFIERKYYDEDGYFMFKEVYYQPIKWDLSEESGELKFVGKYNEDIPIKEFISDFGILARLRMYLLKLLTV